MASSTFGSGWPTCDRSAIVTLSRSDGLRIAVHRDMLDLFQICLDVTEALGYDVIPGQTWGYACRAISGTTRPSNHSWGTAIDINAPSNPRRADRKFVSNIPKIVVDFWKGQGFRWGGEYSWPDPMHFEFMGTAADARRRAANLRAFFAAQGGQSPTPAVPTPPPFPGTVRFGDRGNAVRVWQHAFRDRRGYRDLVIDGIFGQATNHVVWHFQSHNGLVADCVAGKRTWHAVWFG